MNNKIKTYKELLSFDDFEYYFRFKKMDDNFDSLWRMKSNAREALKEWILSIKHDTEKADVTSNACGELVENCIKYSQRDTYAFVFIHVTDNTITIQTLNKCTPEQKNATVEYIKFINSEDTPLEEIYIKKVTESLESGKSQLGLLKILMETKGTMEILDDEDDIFHIKVTIIL